VCVCVCVVCVVRVVYGGMKGVEGTRVWQPLLLDILKSKFYAGSVCAFVCVCALCVLCMGMKGVGGTRANRSEVCVVVCCVMLQGAARHCSVLQCVAVCCSVLQCVAVCCNVWMKGVGATHLRQPLLVDILKSKF